MGATTWADLRRASVLMSAEEAVEGIEDGMTIAIGGMSTSSRPMTLIRALVRRGARDLTVVGGAMGGLDVDLLIGLGMVGKVVAGTVGAGELAPIGPWFRRAAEAGSLEVWECDEGSLYLALRAAALGAPFLPWRSGLGTSLPELNPELRIIDDPCGDGQLIAVPAIRPDVALVHAARADEYGNVQHVGAGFSDDLLHRASARTIVQVEQVIPNEQIRQHPRHTTIVSADAVVRAPYGAHPSASPGFYLADEDALRDYVVAAKGAGDDEAGWLSWLQREVLSDTDHIYYLEHVGIRTLVGLHEL